MGIKLESLYEPPYELCCFCFQPTPHWAVEKDVACCEECAAVKVTSDLPTKEKWFKAVEAREANQLHTIVTSKYHGMAH